MAEEKPRKRLPVLGQSSENEARPRWHWVVVVALGTLFGWLLLEMIAVASVAEWVAGHGNAAVVVVHLVALTLPAAGSGALSGRVGKRARMVDAAGGAVGLVVSVSALAVARLGGEAVWSGAVAVAAVVAGASAAVGFAVGRRKARFEG